LTRRFSMLPVIFSECRRAKRRAPRERSGDHGVPASERVGGTAGAKPPGSEMDENILDAAREFFGM
jgi:hypothetical protein